MYLIDLSQGYDGYPPALAASFEAVWNSEVGYDRFAGTKCARVGVMERRSVFVCTSQITTRDGHHRKFRALFFSDGGRVR